MTLNPPTTPQISPRPSPRRFFPPEKAAGQGSRLLPRGSQRALFCPCGAPFPSLGGWCRACYRRRQHSTRAFGGHREQALVADAGRCRACGATQSLHVHHRRAGDHRALVTLCAACHARVHRTGVWRRPLPELLRTLWREWHPRHPEQRQLPLA